MAGTSELAIFFLRDRTNITISSMSTFKTIKYFYNVACSQPVTSTSTETMRNEIEMIDIPVGGRQCTTNLTVLVEWNNGGVTKRARSVDKVF